MSERNQALDISAFDDETRRLQRVARGLLFESHGAEDVVQEAWLALLRPASAQPDSRGAWLTATVRRLAGGARREAARRRRREERAARGDRTDGAAQVAARIELLRRVLDAVEKLDEPYRQTIVLRFFDDLPPREIARRVGVPVETVRTRLRRGLERLRRELDDGREGGRAAFLGALLPLAGRPPWELGPFALAASKCSTWTGAIVVKSQVQIAVVGVFGLALLAVLGWMAIDRMPAPEAEGTVAVAPMDIDRQAAREPKSSTIRESRETTDTTRESVAATATEGGDWIVRGYVTLARRELLPSARLHARSYVGTSAEGELIDERWLITDDEGRFEWPLERPPESVMLELEIDQEDRFMTSSSVVVPKGDEAPQEIVLSVYPLDVTIVGVVLDPDRQPIRGARVVRYRGEVLTDEEGEYRFRASSFLGSVRMTVIAPGYRHVRVTAMPRGPGEVRAEEAVLGPALQLRGRILDEERQPVAHCKVATGPQDAISTRTDEEGQFVLDSLAPSDRKLYFRLSAAGYCTRSESLEPEQIEAGAVEWVLERGVSVSGTVRDTQGTGLGGVHLVIGRGPNSFPQLETWSRADGSYEFQSVDASEDSLWATRAGLRSSYTELLTPSDAESCSQIDVVMEKGHYLAGRVLDENGLPVPFVHIYVNDRSNRRWTPRGEGDAEGRFRMTDLHEGRVQLGFLAQGFTRHEQYFGELDRSDLVVILQRSGSLAGRVVDGASGAPIPAFRIKFVAPSIEEGERRLSGYWAGWSKPGVPFVDTDGYWTTADSERLRIGAPIGIEVSAEGYGATVIDRVLAEAGPDPDAFVIELYPGGARIEGQVVAQGSGLPIAGATVRTLRGTGDPWGDEQDPITTDQGGRFVITDIPNGSATLHVKHPQWKRGVDGPFEVEPSARVFRQVVLSKGGAVSGKLRDRDGALLSGEDVVLNVMEVVGSEHRKWEQETDEEGAFRFEGLLPGSYQLSWKRDITGDQQSYVMMRQVMVNDGETAEVELRPLGRTLVHGTLTSEGALPATLHVHMRPRTRTVDSQEERADYYSRMHSTVAVNGAFRFEDIAPGRYRISVTSRDYNAEGELEVPAEGEIEAWLELKERGR